MKLRTFIILALFVVLITNVATSCPVCYGETDANTASAVNAAIFSMLFVIGAVLSFFVSMVLHMRKRIKLESMNNSNEAH